MKNTTDELKALRAAKAATASLNEAEAGLRAQHTALLQEKKMIGLSLASKEEALANMNRIVDAKAAEWAKGRGVGIARDVSGHKDVFEGTTRERFVHPRLPHWGDAHGTIHFEDLVGLVPNLIKERLAEVIAQSGARFGLPAEAKAKRLAEIENELTAVEAQHLALVEGAGECGLKYELLAVVRERREAEALATQRAAELAADRARGIFTVQGVGGRA